MSVGQGRASRYNRRLRIERKIAAIGFARAGAEQWEVVASVWGEVLDTLPSRSERSQDGLQIATGTSRIRMRWRAGITADMRIQVGRVVGDAWVTDRTMEIVGGPAEMGRRDGLEMMAQDYSTAGGAQ